MVMAQFHSDSEEEQEQAREGEGEDAGAEEENARRRQHPSNEPQSATSHTNDMLAAMVLDNLPNFSNFFVNDGDSDDDGVGIGCGDGDGDGDSDCNGDGSAGGPFGKFAREQPAAEASAVTSSEPTMRNNSNSKKVASTSASAAEAVEAAACFDDDGLPLCDSPPSPLSATERVESAEQLRARRKRRAASAAAVGVGTVSGRDLRILASPMKSNIQRGVGNGRPLKDAAAAAAINTRMEGYVMREVGSSWKKRYLILQGTILKVLKTAPPVYKGRQSVSSRKGDVAEYMIVSKDTKIKLNQRNKVEILIEMPAQGFKTKIRCGGGQGDRAVAAAWLQVLSNSRRIAKETIRAQLKAAQAN
jgi:hypothetical protein